MVSGMRGAEVKIYDTPAVQKHFVTFLSPGTFVSETTTKEIDGWSVDTAQRMAAGITERHGAKPYGFYFTTRSRGLNDLDSKITETSGTYYLGGQVFTVAQVEALGDPKNSILLDNMKSNGWGHVVRTKSPYVPWHQLKDGDFVLDEVTP